MKMKMVLPSCGSAGLLNQYIAGLAACLSVLTSGNCCGWITPIVPHLLGPDSEIPMTQTEFPWVISLIELGNLVSPLPAGILSNYIGRKPVIWATGVFYVVSWLMILYFPSVIVLCVARTIQGFGMGLTFTATPVYLGEIASDTNRGAMTSLFFNFWWMGYLIEYIMGPLLSFKNFTYFTLALNVPFLVLFFFQPESPYFYMLTGEEEKAFKSLKWFRDKPDEKLREELDEIKFSIESEAKSVKFQDLFATKGDRRAMAILIVLTAVRICSGTGSITVFATEIFDQTPNLSISSDVVTMALGVVMFVGGCVSSFTSDTFGRRTLLLVSCLGSFVCQFFTGTYYFLLTNTSVEVSNFSWIAPVFILAYSGVCTAGLYPVCSCYTSELFSSKTRGLAASIGAVNVTIFSFLVLVSYQPIIDWLGLYANFYLYTIILFLGGVYFYVYAPETKGKSFALIRKELVGSKETGFDTP